MHFKENLNDMNWYIIQQPCNTGSEYVIILFIYGETAAQRSELALVT